MLDSEIAGLGRPRAALLGFAVAVLAYNVLPLLARCVEVAHQQPQPLPSEVSTYHLARQIRGGYEGSVDGQTARAHVATARVLAQARTPP